MYFTFEVRKALTQSLSPLPDED